MTTEHAVDLSGVRCPMPIVHLARMITNLDDGDTLQVVADDPAFCLDVESWCRRSGHELAELELDGERCLATIRKHAEPRGDQ